MAVYKGIIVGGSPNSLFQVTLYPRGTDIPVAEPLKTTGAWEFEVPEGRYDIEVCSLEGVKPVG